MDFRIPTPGTTRNLMASMSCIPLCLLCCAALAGAPPITQVSSAVEVRGRSLYIEGEHILDAYEQNYTYLCNALTNPHAKLHADATTIPPSEKIIVRDQLLVAAPGCTLECLPFNPTNAVYAPSAEIVLARFVKGAVVVSIVATQGILLEHQAVTLPQAAGMRAVLSNVIGRGSYTRMEVCVQKRDGTRECTSWNYGVTVREPIVMYIRKRPS